MIVQSDHIYSQKKKIFIFWNNGIIYSKSKLKVNLLHVSKRLVSFTFDYNLMARNKLYIEEEVLDKAMNLFWKNGFASTSMQKLESEMGINKFSIYSSFGKKEGIFLRSLKCNKNKLNVLLLPLNENGVGPAAIKKYFYDFIEFSKEVDTGKGCLITNTANELNDDTTQEIREYISSFTAGVKEIFVRVLGRNTSRISKEIEQQADYLLLAMFGFHLQPDCLLIHNWRIT